MLREMLCRVVVWTVIAAATSVPVHGAEQREWSDVSGRFGVTAAFVRRNDFGVVLREASGGELHLLWDQISRRDQEYVDKAVAADPKLRVTCPQAQAFVQVTAEGKNKEGTFADMADGLVFHADAERAKILVLRNMAWQHRFTEAKPEEIQYRATTFTPTGPRESSLTRLKMAFEEVWDGDHRRVFLGPRSELPEPISWGQRLNAKAGDVLYLIYFERRYSGSDVKVFTREVEPVVVRRVFRLPDGTTHGFEIECAERRDVRHGIVVADDGSTFAIVQRARRSEDVHLTNLIQLQENKERYWECIGPQHAFRTTSATAPFGRIGSRKTAVPEGWKIDVTAMIGEPVRKTTAMKMLIEPGIVNGNPRTMFVVDGGEWKNASPRGQVLELRKLEPFDPAFAFGRHTTPLPDHSYWTGSTTVELPPSNQGITFDFVARDEAGGFRARRSATHWKPDGFYRADEETDHSVYDLPTLKPKSKAVP